jgi:hypothetical protein
LIDAAQLIWAEDMLPMICDQGAGHGSGNSQPGAISPPEPVCEGCEGFCIPGVPRARAHAHGYPDNEKSLTSLTGTLVRRLGVFDIDAAWLALQGNSLKAGSPRSALPLALIAAAFECLREAFLASDKLANAFGPLTPVLE